MRLFKSVLGLLSLLFLLQSCYTTRVLNIEVAEPAKITVDEDLQSILLLSRNFPPDYMKKERDRFKFNGKYIQDKVNLDSVFAVQSLKYLGGLLQDGERFQIENPDSILYIKSPFYEFKKPLDSDIVKKICSEQEVDGILVVEDAYIKEDIVYDYFIGEVYKLIGARYDIHYKLYHKNGIRYFEKNYVDTLIFEYNAYYDTKENSSDFEAYAQPLLDDGTGYFNRWTLMDECAFEGATQFNQHISPWWQTEERFYFYNNNKHIKAGAEYAAQNNWVNAAGEWKKAIEHKSSSTRGMAMFNLALASEMNGNIDVAIHWARKSYDELNLPDVKNYVTRLDKRRSTLRKFK
jgi:hypothetical protein